MSVASHQSPHSHCPTRSKTPGLTTNHTDPALRPLLSVPQIQFSVLTSNSVSSTASTPSSVCSPRLGTNVGRQKRRKLRNARASSSSSSLLTPPLSPDLPVLRPTRKAAARAQLSPDPSSDLDDDEPALPVSRLQLTRAAPPVPPPIPADVVIAPSRPPYSLASWVARSYNTPRRTRHLTHTCIQTSTHPNSVSVSTEPPAHFQKMQPKQLRGHRPVQPPGDSEALLGSRRAMEQEKWWWWSKPCPHTGDGNKSANLPALRCLDLDDDHQGPHMAILTKKFNDCPIEHQKFYCTW